MPDYRIAGHENNDVTGGANEVWSWSCSCGKASNPGSRMSYRQAQAALARHLKAARMRTDRETGNDHGGKR